MTTERENVVSVRLSDVEHAALTEAAEALGLKVSQYVRLAALEKAGPVKRSSPAGDVQ